MTYKILHGNNLDILPTLADNSIDSIVTDPPYELGFMGKKWDSSGIAYSVDLWQQCLRVLKPGGHLLAFSGSRTYHRMVVAIEDAGFEIRDMISWISNKTFPKSLDISKAIEKASGVAVKQGVEFNVAGGIANNPTPQGEARDAMRHMPQTDSGKQWQGWGTALKPTVEPIVMARKPLEGTVAENVLAYGTGGLNIDASRINNLTDKEKNWTPQRQHSENPIQFGGARSGDVVSMYKEGGRWPANVILDPYTAELLDEQSGITKSGAAGKKASSGFPGGGYAGEYTVPYGDTGGASRFFYVAKASKRDRNEGLDQLEDSVVGSFSGNVANNGNKIGAEPDKPNQPAKNFHPTVKPTDLMRYLIKLVTPPNGTVLDPFTGSGSTGKAAILEGFDFIGIEMTEEYLPIIEGRLKHAEAKVAELKEQDKAKESEKLF